MKYYYFFLISITSFTINAQTNCDNANSYLVSAYSHVKDAYDANNISHLKYYANRSLESFKLSKKNLSDCNCIKVLELSNKAIDLLAKVESAETFEDGRFYVKRARDISKESVIEIDKCSASTTIYNDTDENDALTDLQNEQRKLKQQQEALKLKEAEIKKKLAAQSEKELKLKKEQLILSYKSTVALNIKTYNETLKACNCNYKAIKAADSLEDLTLENMDTIQKHYINELKVLASNYVSQLNSCDN
ncbi:hypothetical protein [Thalassobellus suaedae]|uniref:Uncharacterized protein n=1 Tax=Thalassobellus suaedae TaxID=3074124 RepID=A0ABY9Y3V5_9FLAO|nr:hypothetical protein RHP49_01325 [Flavobacteriaceae bacterium HL-DH10]